MELSDRLQAVANMVTPGNKVADVGCDHAYISIYLVKNKISDKVIAMDVNKGPLAKARENISRHAFEDKIETRLSDGLEKLSANEIDTIIIAGMGGGLTCKILEEGIDKLVGVKELILQPQSELDLVRKLLERLNYNIITEKMLIDDGKYYVVMRAVYVKDKSGELNQVNEYNEDIEEAHYLYGKYLLVNKDPVLHQFLLQQKEVLSNIKDKLIHTHTINAKNRLEEVKREIRFVDVALSYYKNK